MSFGENLPSESKTSLGKTRMAAALSEATSALAAPAHRRPPPRIAQAPERKGFRFTVRIALLLSTVRENPATTVVLFPVCSVGGNRDLVDHRSAAPREAIALHVEIERDAGRVPLCVGTRHTGDAKHRSIDRNDARVSDRRSEDREGEDRRERVLRA